MEAMERARPEGVGSLLVLSAMLGAGCITGMPTSINRTETVALVLVVKEAETGRPVEGAVVEVKGGRFQQVTAGATNREGEFSLVETYHARGAQAMPRPPRYTIEVAKEGYRRLFVIVDTEDYLHSALEARLFKELEVTLKPGRGSDVLDLARPLAAE